MSEASLKKHVYGRVRKYNIKPLEDFDPCPPNCVGKMKDPLPALLEQVHGKSLGISFLFDSSTRYWDTDSKPESYDMPTVTESKKKS